MSSGLRSAGLPGYNEAAATVASFARGLVSLPKKTERVSLADAAGRVLATAVVADADQPPFARSTRDGYACRAAELASGAALTVAGMTHAGQGPAAPLAQGAAWEIMTGAPTPEGADAVVMLEHVSREQVGRGGESIRLLDGRSLKAGDNIVARSAQAARGAELLRAGVRVGPGQIAVAASCGYAVLDVYQRPRVAILTTGDELVAVDASPGPGQIRNSNAPMLTALVAAAGGEPWALPAARDTADELDKVLSAVIESEAELLLISGGVSAGRFDLVEPALECMGARFHFTGVRMQPGKPVVFGEAPARGRMLPFFGLPGNPISSSVTFLLFGAPLLGVLAGCAYEGPRFALAKLSDAIERNANLTRFLPAWCGPGGSSGDAPQVATVPWHGSGDLPAFGRSNCFVVVPEGGELAAGEMVRILMV